MLTDTLTKRSSLDPETLAAMHPTLVEVYIGAP